MNCLSAIRVVDVTLSLLESCYALGFYQALKHAIRKFEPENFIIKTFFLLDLMAIMKTSKLNQQQIFNIVE